MTIIIQQKNQKQKIFIAIVIVMFAAMAFVLWQGFFKKPPVETGEILIFNQQEDINIDLDALQHPFLKTFQPFFEIQPFSASGTEALGRENPFLPLK